MTLYCITINGHLAPVVPSRFMSIVLFRAEAQNLTGYKVEQRVLEDE